MNIRTRRGGRPGLAACGALLILSACSPVYNNTLESTPTSHEALITQRVREASDAQGTALTAIDSLCPSSGVDQAGGASRESLTACEQRVWEARKRLASVEDVAGPSSPSASADPSVAGLASLLTEARAAAAALEPLDTALQRRIADPASAPPLDPRLDAARAGMRRFVVAADAFLARNGKTIPAQ